MDGRRWTPSDTNTEELLGRETLWYDAHAMAYSIDERNLDRQRLLAHFLRPLTEESVAEFRLVESDPSITVIPDPNVAVWAAV